MKVAQSCPVLFHPMDSSPPGSSVCRIPQARIRERVAISFLNFEYFSFNRPRAKLRTLCKFLPCCTMLSHFSPVQLFATPWTVACQAPLSMGILQVRRLEWVPMPFSRGSSQLRDETQVSCFTGRFFTIWATKEDPLSTYITIFLNFLSIQFWKCNIIEKFL